MSTPCEMRMHEISELTNHVRVSCYAYRVGVVCRNNKTFITVRFTQYSQSMQLENDIGKEELDEAMSHLRATQKNTHDMRIAQWCMEEIDRLLDAKLEKAAQQ